MKFYLGGPMTGLPEFNFPYFERVAKQLRNIWDFDILSAHEVEFDETNGKLPYMQYIKGDLKVLLDCDAVIFLPGWESSRGCNIEYKVARILDMPVFAFCPETLTHPPSIQEIPR